MITDEEDARAWLRKLPECTEQCLAKLERFVEMLVLENERQNLVARSSLASVWLRHIADSAQLLEHVPRGTPLNWLDLGTGSGFPGLIVGILRSDVRMTMVESRARRVEWLERVCDELDLGNATVLGSRLELVEAAPMDVISARAFAPLPQLLQLSSRFSTSSTLWLLPKGRSAAQEVNELRGWRHMFHVEPSLTDPEAGIVVGTLTGRKGSEQ